MSLKRPNILWPALAGITLALAGLGGCAQSPPGEPAVAASDAPAAASGTLKLERVVMLMRHGVRSPTKPQVAPEGMADREWPTWSTGFGELTQHGYDAVRLVGAWDRTHWAARGLIPTDGCPSQDTVAVAASAKSRTQDTARALAEGMAPGCAISATIRTSCSSSVPSVRAVCWQCCRWRCRREPWGE